MREVTKEEFDDEIAKETGMAASHGSDLRFFLTENEVWTSNAIPCIYTKDKRL